MSTRPAAASAPAARRCWTVVSARDVVDVEVTARDDERLGAVLPVLARTLGLRSAALWHGSARLPDALPLASPQLAHGTVLGLGGPGPRPCSAPHGSALELHVVGGPEAGTTLPLGRGRHVLGRGAGATVHLEDPDISRRHVLVEIGSGGITVADLGSTNGSRLDGTELDCRPRSWPTGAVLRLGVSAVSVSGPAGAPACVTPAAGGRFSVQPAIRMAAPHPEVEVPVPGPPPSPPRRRLAWAAVSLPALGGVLMAWLFDAPHFLLLTLLGPLVALGTWASERWTGRRSRRRDAAAHALDLRTAQARLAEAVRADVRAAEAAHPDLATLTTAARRRSALLWTRRRTDPDALVVRVGSGPGPTRVTRLEPDGRRVPEPADHLPVVVDLAASGGLAVLGPRPRALGVVAGVLAQVAALHAPGEVDLALLVTGDRLADWAWTRWLPHLTPGTVHVRSARQPGSDDPAAEEPLVTWLTGLAERQRVVGGNARDGGDTGSAPTRVVAVVDRPAEPRLRAALAAARPAGVVTLAVADAAEALSVTPDAVLTLTGETGDVATLLRTGAAEQPVAGVDRLPRRISETFARNLAALAPVTSVASLPREVRLLDLPASGLGVDVDGTMTGQWSRTRRALRATLGRTAEGLAEIDLCRQGPHVLVAGTTGSGKSELLQTLVAGLALQHPPDRCSFLLVDYKGGAAFAEAAELPHTVGVVTDLDGQTTARALRSLTAELSRREALLAAHGVPDLAALPESVDLARLVIVVDEFAGLAEELPTFVSGLVAIAQRGRSLGVHLVLATQRPSGVVSPEIRANSTLRICLRTTDEADSRDVLGTPQAAFLPVDLPGRAFLRAGNGNPIPVQVARVAVPAPATGDPGPQVHRWSWPRTGSSGPAERPSGGNSDLARLTSALRRAAEQAAVPVPHRPWRPALPDRLAAADLDRLGGSARGAGIPATVPGAAPAPLRIGLVDRPDLQSQEPLELDLARSGSWLAVGGARSGRTTLLRTVLAEAVRAQSPDRLHVHVLDHGGGALAAEASALPHTGTAVGGNDALRTVRLLERLGEEVATRRTAGGAADAPHLLLLVDGVESLNTQLDDADPGRGSTALLRLLRDGAAAGLTCVLTADRAVPGGRLAGAVGHRLVLPLPDRADYAVAGIPPRAVPDHRPPGRALLGEDALECQLALPRPTESTARYGRSIPSGALCIPELPRDPVLALPEAGVTPLLLPVGPGGDEGTVLEVDLARTGGLLVAGPPGSGRSTAVQAFARHLAAAGAAVLQIGRPEHGPLHDARGSLTALGGDDLEGWRSWLAARGSTPGVVVVDDHGSWAEAPVVAAMAATDLPGFVLIAAGTAGELSGVYRGPVTALRRRRAGLLLTPGPGDAELLGVRLPRTPVPFRPGSGWLVDAGGCRRVQVAGRRGDPRSPAGLAGPPRSPAAPTGPPR